MGEKYNCKVEGCNRKYHLKGYCRLHLRAYETYGDPYKTTVPRRSRRKKIAFEIDDNGCFICTSHKVSKGKGMGTVIYILRHPKTHGEIKTTDERKAKYLQEIGYVLVNEYDLTKADKVKE